ncbi:hypothetical protein L484_022698 [Morus notabilis]|uniref:Uncharacterized protein n=1 Tax=Morus notabilis TaxID=981085 RepID=W9QXZ2_9ROSA|nr:uncharacterized protein LOC21405507 [Morus notabilis]EXB57591.1 hypothetical protein L484_022698 [Morus notabilis]
MAYRRRQQGISNSRPSTTTFNEEENGNNSLSPPPSISASAYGNDWYSSSSSSSSSSSLAAKAIRASSAYRDSSLSSAYGGGGGGAGVGRGTVSSTTSTSSASRYPIPVTPSPPASFSKESRSYEYTSMKNLNEPKQGFWGTLARKAKAILDDDNEPQQFDRPQRTKVEMPTTETRGKYHGPDQSGESRRRTDNPTLQKRLDALTSSFNYIGGTIGNALEEGITRVENRTVDIIQETRKHIRKKPGSSESQNQAQNSQSQMQTDLELQLKASRDVAMAMAAKAKLLLRELKTVKADFAFAKERCAQLEEENKILRENRERGDDPEDDDLIRLQLETLLAEKARLAHENSVYARENRFLREVVEYHQLTMQDVVYLDEGTEEVTEVYPMKVIPGNPSPSPEVRGVSKGAA